MGERSRTNQRGEDRGRILRCGIGAEIVDKSPFISNLNIIRRRWAPAARHGELEHEIIARVGNRGCSECRICRRRAGERRRGAPNLGPLVSDRSSIASIGGARTV